MILNYVKKEKILLSRLIFSFSLLFLLLFLMLTYLLCVVSFNCTYYTHHQTYQELTRQGDPEVSWRTLVLVI